MRVGVIALLHESNTFIPARTTLAEFEDHLLLEGEEVRERLATTRHEVGGFFEQLAEDRIEAVPLFAARAMPFGPIAQDAAAELTRRLLQCLDGAGPLDGLLVAPHGAAVAENELDFDGFWLSEVRRAKPGVPIAGT